MKTKTKPRFKQLNEAIDKLGTKPRALIYVRTSGEESEDENSLYIQNNDCIRYCEYKGYDTIDLGYTIEVKDKNETKTMPVRGVVDNGYTGANLKREGIQRVIQMARNKEFDYLIVWKLDRFSRKVIDVLTVLEEFEKLNIKFFSVQEPFLDTSTIYGKFLLQILAVIAELERENIKLRTQGGRNVAMRNGHWHGSPPYGYDKDDQFRLVPNLDKLKIVKDLFRWAVYDGFSLNEMAKALNDRGLKTTRGGKWLGSTIRTTILSNPIYTGEAMLRRTQKKELQIPYRVEPVISKELFERARITLNSNRNSLRGKTKHPAKYAPYLYCARCNGKMYPQGSHNRKGELVVSYSGNRNTKDKPKTRCANCGWIKQKLLDFAIIPQLLKLTNDPQFWLYNMEDKKIEDLTPILEIELRARENLVKERLKIERKFDIGFYKNDEECRQAIKEADKAIEFKDNDILLIKQGMATQAEKDQVIAGMKSVVDKLKHLKDFSGFMKLVLNKIFIDTKSRKITIHLRLPLMKPLDDIYPKTEEEGVASLDKRWPRDLFNKEVDNKLNVDIRKQFPYTNRVVADKSLLGKKSNKYHYSWCSSWKKIKPENQVWFNSDKEAEAAGYTLAGNCTK